MAGRHVLVWADMGSETSLSESRLTECIVTSCRWPGRYVSFTKNVQ